MKQEDKETSWKPSKEEMDVLYGLAYITNKYDEHKEEVIARLYQDLKREFFNGSSYENMFPNTENDVRRRSTIQVLEYARSLDNYNQYGKADIDKNIAWLEKQGKSALEARTDNELIEEEDLPNLKEAVLACQNIERTTLNRNYMSELLNDKFYRKIKSGDYLQEIESLANCMVDEGYADASFPELLLKRERIVTTIYGNGVAGPHGMKLNAIEESIGVIIVEEDMTYNDSKIRIIFLLNICKGSLFLYREITRFLTAIMNDSDLVDQLVNASDYKAFLKTVDTIKY